MDFNSEASQLATCKTCDSTGYLPDEEVFGIRCIECPDCDIAKQKGDEHRRERARLRKRVEDAGLTWDEYLESEYDYNETMRTAQMQ